MEKEVPMKTLPKWILVIAVTGLVVGTFVTLSHGIVNPLLQLAMPLGFIFAGLFVITRAMQNEMAQFDEEERRKMEAAERNGYSVKGRNHSMKAPVAPDNTKSRGGEFPAHHPMQTGEHSP